MANDPAEEALSRADQGIDGYTRRYLAEHGRAPDHNPRIRAQERKAAADYLAKKGRPR